MFVARRNQPEDDDPLTIFENSVKLGDLPSIVKGYKEFFNIRIQEGFGSVASLLTPDGTDGMVYLNHTASETQVVEVILGHTIIVYSFWNRSIAQITCGNTKIRCYSDMSEQERNEFNLQFNNLLKVFEPAD